MLLSDEHRAVQEAVRNFVQEQIAPHAARWDRESHFPAVELKGLAALGCYGVAVPEQWGGAGLDYLALAIILEEIAAGDGGTSTSGERQQLPGVLHPDGLGSEGQKAQWLTPLARGEMLGAFT